MTISEFGARNVPRSTQLLKGLQPQQIDLILGAAKSRQYPPKSVMTHQSERADCLFLLWKGRARFFMETPDGQKINLRWITPGLIFGVMALVPTPSAYLVSAEAVQESTVLFWDGRTIRDLARRFASLFENAFLICVEYLSWYVATHCALVSQTAHERLAHILLGYAPSIGQKIPGGIELDVTNEELANAANMSSYTASRLMSQWEKAGAISKQRKKILLRSPEKLFGIVVSSRHPHSLLTGEVAETDWRQQ
jgi:CRP-like cAMP-binding protein